MGFIVRVRTRGLDSVNWVGERDKLGAPCLMPHREEARVFPTHEEAQSMAWQVVMFRGSSIRYLILEK
jgi:hypothetical protein